jgi:regulator of protease activity HflC (stomatin/prohibitin superfamily)
MLAANALWGRTAAGCYRGAVARGSTDVRDLATDVDLEARASIENGQTAAMVGLPLVMDCHIDWTTSEVEHGKLRVSLAPAPDFAFMMEFDGIVDPLKHHVHQGWGGVVLAHGHIVVSDVRIESAQELRGFLDETVTEANRLAVDTRARQQQEAQARAASAAEHEAQRSAAAHAAAQRDSRLTDAFRRSG